jgi:NAD(P)-dependent dehydrogenase (short-subunit alcohol dehydrogenase family)
MSKSVAIVTGAASGLGLATATKLHAEGFAVVGIDKRIEPGVDAWAALGDNARLVAADVTSEADVSAAIAIATSMGDLRASVSCAGVGWASRVLNKEGAPHALDLFKTIIEVNLVGTFNVLRLAAAAMAKNEPDADKQRGVIINTASVAAFEGQIGQVAYSASKGGVAAMTLPVARDLAQLGIRAVTVAPGIFDTPMLAALPEKAREALAASVPNPSRLGSPAEYADLVWTIVRSHYINGETIRIDGSLRMAPR